MTTKETAVIVERWRPVVGLEGLYEVSDLGRVRSLGRIDSIGRRIQARVLEPSPSWEGYVHVGLATASTPGCPGTTVRRRVQHLVLEAFVGPRPLGMEACHGDDVGANNVLSNLRWDTQDANWEDHLRNQRGDTAKWRREHPRGASLLAQTRGSGYCIRQHLLMEPNLTNPQGAEKRQRCLACARGHNNVYDAQRFNDQILNIDIEADRHYEQIMQATTEVSIKIPAQRTAPQDLDDQENSESQNAHPCIEDQQVENASGGAPC